MGVGDKRIRNSLDGFRNHATSYVPRKTGLYVDAIHNAGYISRNAGIETDNVLFEPIKDLSTATVSVKYEKATLDFPRRWGGYGWDIGDSRKDLPTNLKIRDWVGWENGEPVVTLHYVGTVNGTAWPWSGAGRHNNNDDLHAESWVYRCGRKFAQAPGFVSGCARHKDANGRYWLVVSSWELLDEGEDIYTDQYGEDVDKFVLYYAPWQYMGENAGITDMMIYDESNPTENRKWRKITAPKYPFFYQFSWWDGTYDRATTSSFNASGTEYVTLLPFYNVVFNAGRESVPDDIRYYNDYALGDTVELITTKLEGIGTPDARIVVENRYTEYLENIIGALGSVEITGFKRWEKSSGVYNSPLTGNQDKKIRTKQEAVDFGAVAYEGGCVVAADYHGDDLVVYTIEPEIKTAIYDAIGDYYSYRQGRMAHAEINTSLEPSGDFEEPVWNEPETEEQEGYWSCPTAGYVYYAGNGGVSGEKGMCAKPGWGWEKTINVTENNVKKCLDDAPWADKISANAMTDNQLVMRRYVNGVKQNDPDIRVGLEASMGEMTYTLDYYWDNTDKKFKHKFSSGKNAYSPIAAEYSKIQWRMLIDPRYGLVALNPFGNNREWQWEAYTDIDPEWGKRAAVRSRDGSMAIDYIYTNFPDDLSYPGSGVVVYQYGNEIIDESRPIPEQTGTWSYNTQKNSTPPSERTQAELADFVKGWEAFDYTYVSEEDYEAQYGEWEVVNSTLQLIYKPFAVGMGNSLYGNIYDGGFIRAKGDSELKVVSTEGIKYVGNGKDLYMVSFRYWDTVSSTVTTEEPMGEHHYWINPSLASFTNGLQTSSNPLDVMDLSESDATADQVAIGNLYLFL